VFTRFTLSSKIMLILEKGFKNLYFHSISRYLWKMMKKMLMMTFPFRWN